LTCGRRPHRLRHGRRDVDGARERPRAAMYSLKPRQGSTHAALVVGITSVYLAITSTVSLFHTEDCREAHRRGQTSSSSPSSSPCPACKFLGGSNSTAAHDDPPPIVIESPTTSEVVQHSVVVVASPCTGSILLRAPPASSLL